MILSIEMTFLFHLPSELSEVSEVSVLSLTVAGISVPEIKKKKKATISLFCKFFNNSRDVLVSSKVFDVSWQ